MTCEKGGNTEVLLHKLDILGHFYAMKARPFALAEKIDTLDFMSRGPQFKF